MTASRFSVGDRVVVTDKYRHAGGKHDMTGYYGHIVRQPSDGHPDALYGVNLQGRINGEPVRPHPVARLYDFPLYASELEHVD